jgi:Pyruvate/2-oxoacid:ferredoxin oxidoreductase delta subunit
VAKDVYVELREFLHGMPGGYPATESGVELEILKKLFTPEQARLTMQLTQVPESASDFASRTGIGEEEALEGLEDLAREGLIFRVRSGESTSYAAISFVIGIYEFQLNKIDREFAELFEKYQPTLMGQMESTRTRPMRVIPVDSAIDATTAVASYDQVRELVKNKELISVAPCICQKEQGLLGNSCRGGAERCIQFGSSAQYYIDNGMARRIDMDELMRILKKGEEDGLVLCPTNTQHIPGMCMCCSCCCPILRSLGSLERPVDHVQTTFRAEIDVDLCNGCGLCEERCQMTALVEREAEYAVDEVRCIGCGLCISECPLGAISLVELAEVAPVPGTTAELGMNIMKERGLV